MPTFDLGGWPQVHAVVPGFRILATMYYPVDRDLRAELHATLVATFYNTVRADPNAWTREPTMMEMYPLFHARHVGGNQIEVFQRAREVACRGSVAGEVLIIMSQLAEHEQRGSVNKACHVLAEAGAAGKATSGGVLIPFKNRTALRNHAWIPYRCVTHLWAAHNLMWNFRRSEGPGDAPPQITWYERASDFERFLVIAEAFRKWGEGHIAYPSPTQVPTLPPDETWRLPAGMALPEKHLTPPPLESWYAQYLRTYRA
jgi:hypothetical protein